MILVMAMEMCAMAALLLAADLAVAVVLAYPVALAFAQLTRVLLGPGKAGWLLCALGLPLAIAVTTIGILPSSGDSGSLRDFMVSIEYKRVLALSLAVTVLWVRGWTLQGRTPGADEASSSFQLGLAVLVVAAIFSASNAAESREFAALAMAFLVFGLLALSRARTPYVTVAALAIVFLLGFAVAIVVDRSTLEPVLAVPAWLAGEITAALRSFSELAPALPDAGDRPQAREPGLPAQNEPGWVRPLFAFMRDHELVLGCLALAVLLVGGVWVLAQYRRRWTRLAAGAPGIIYGRSAAGLREWLARLMHKLRTGWLACSSSFALWTRRIAWMSGRGLSVREMYQATLWRLAVKKCPRAPHESPEEYHRRLSRVCPGLARPLGALTEAFVADRYGPRRVARDSLATTWGELRGEMARMRRANG